MKWLSIAALVMAAALPVGAAGDHEIQAAQQELKIAMDHLRNAGTDYGGHRRAAMDAIDKALKEIQQAINFSRSGEPAAKGKHPAKEPAEPPADED